MAKYADEVEEVVRTVADANKPTVYETMQQVSRLIAAIDCGLCRLVKDEHHLHKLYDERWNVTLGVELTSQGEIHVGG